MRDGRYTLPQRWLHWIIAILVLGALASGTVLYIYGFAGLKNAFGIDVTNAVFKYHKTAGVLILALMVLRVLLRLGLGAPAPASGLTGSERLLSASVHGILYAALLALPVLGWLATAAGGFPVEFFNMKLPGLIGRDKALSQTLYTLHGLTALTVAGLLFLHIAGALRHRFIRKDGVMRRMSLSG